MKEKIIVTGGMGRLGHKLVNQLKEKYSILIIDSLLNKKLPDLPEGVEISTFDLSSKDWPALLRFQLKNSKFVFHLAGITDPNESIKFPHEYHEANVTSTINILSASSTAEVRKFIFPSCYFNKGQFSAPFYCQKSICEMYCKMFYKVYDLNTLSIRLPKTSQQKSLKSISKFLIDSAEDDSLGYGSVIKYNQAKCE